jgi:hypothetical protein
MLNICQDVVMNLNFLSISCQEWRELSEAYPIEMEVITEMMIEAEADLCNELL